jgi:anti-sigma factor RsiW
VITCRRVRRLGGRYAGGLLPIADQEAIAAHLAGCPACAEWLRRRQATLALLHRLPSSTPSPTLRQAILTAAEAPPNRTTSRRVVLRRLGTGVTLAAVGTLAAMVLARVRLEAMAQDELPLPAVAPAGCPNPQTVAVQQMSRPPATPGAGMLPPAPYGRSTLAAVPPGFARAATSRSLALFVDAHSGQVAVKDKRSGLVWLSNPWQAGQPTVAPAASADERGPMPSAVGVAPVYTLSYAPMGQPDITRVMNSSWDATPRRVTSLPDGGTRVSFSLPQQRLQLALDFRLFDGYFDVTIPQDQLLETGTAGSPAGSYVVSVEPLPFFGAGADDEHGSMLLPDGCNTLIPFAAVHNSYLAPYFYDHPTPPIFGIAKQAGGRPHTPAGAFLGVITGDTADAGVFAYPSGYLTRYSHADAQLIYRHPLKSTDSTGKTTVRIPAERLPGDRTVRYYLLTGRDASPSGMLAAYRRYQAPAH